MRHLVGSHPLARKEPVRQSAQQGHIGKGTDLALLYGRAAKQQRVLVGVAALLGLRGLSDPLIFLVKSMGGGNLPTVSGVEAR